MKYVSDRLNSLLVLLVLNGISIAQVAVDGSSRQETGLKLQYRGCWSGANKTLTRMLITKTTIQDTRSRKVFHYAEVSRDHKRNTVVLDLVDEVPSRRRFEIQFVADNEILVGMPMFRDMCTRL